MTPAVLPMDLILYLGAGVIILFIAVILFLRSRAASPAAMRHNARDSRRVRRLDYQPAARPVTPLLHSPPRHPYKGGQNESRAIPPSPATITVIEGRSDIADSTWALAEKYSLAGFTLATADGLVLSTSGYPAAMEDAAQFGGTAMGEGTPEAGGVTLFSLTHQGTRLTGIIRSEKRLSPGGLRRIETDTQEILNRWI